MGFPLFRFTLNNAIEGTLEIKEPDGWDDGILKLERNEDYHSLVEYYDQPLLFDDAQAYDTLLAATLTGGMAYIQNIEYTQGVDALISCEIEISEDSGVTWETIFEATIDIPTVKETDFYKQENGVKRDDFWSKFINRKSIPADLSGSIDMDGNSITPVSSFTLPLPSQRIRQRFERDVNYNDANDVGFVKGIGLATTGYLIFDNSHNIVDEVDERFEYGSQVGTELPTDVFKYLYKVLYPGEYEVNVGIRYNFVLSGSRNYDIKFWYVLRENGTLGTPTQIGSTQSGTGSLIPDDGLRSLSDTVTLQAGDEIYVYGEIILNASATITYFPDYDSDTGGPFVPVYTSFEVIANTIYTDTETDAFLLLDAAKSIISKCVGEINVILSDYLTSGCAEKFAIMKGLHVRGYSLTDKPFAMSFDQWWNGANPIFNMGLGYEKLFGVNKLRIEEKSYFYNPTPSLNLDFVNNIERSYDINKIFKSIEMGYNKWSAESESGVDDPQTKRTWRTRFATVGKDEKMLSIFIAASLAIEQTRRNRVDASKDWRLDDDILIIALNDALDSPEFDENFTSITNLLNDDARYNIRLSVARNFQRWKDYFSGCLQIPGGDSFIFASGEGNYDMTSTSDIDCEVNGVSIDEKGDVAVTSDFLFMPIVYEFEHPLTFAQYKTIRDNKNNAIGVSRTNSGHRACFIQNLDYKPTRGLGKFTVILGENGPL